MAYGAIFENDGNELTFSDSGLVYSFIGRATFVSATQAGTNPTLATSGFSTYTITWPGEIVVALPAKTNGSTMLRNISRSGNTWTIQVHKGNGSYDALGFDVQEQTEVYVFGMPTAATLGTWGMAIFNDAGVVTGDLSRRPLTFRARILTANPMDEWTLPTGAGVPAILGVPVGDSRSSAPGPNNLFNIRELSAAWRINAANGKLFKDEFLATYRRDDAPGDTYTRRRVMNALLIDVTGL